MKPLNFAVIGLGNIGKKHVKAIDSISNAKLGIKGGSAGKIPNHFHEPGVSRV